MQLRRTSVLKVFGLAALMLAIAGGATMASNMGMKHNHQVLGPAPAPAGSFSGLNIVGVPFTNPYATAADYCAAQGINPAGTVIRSDGNNPISYACSDNPATAFTLQFSEALFVNHPTPVSGVLVGAHAPGIPIPIKGPAPAPAGSFSGLNLYAIPYHTTNANAADVCTDLGLASSGVVIRSDANNPISFTCSDNPATAFSLILGEGVIVNNPTPVTPVPSHF